LRSGADFVRKRSRTSANTAAAGAGAIRQHHSRSVRSFDADDRGLLTALRAVGAVPQAALVLHESPRASARDV